MTTSSSNIAINNITSNQTVAPEPTLDDKRFFKQSVDEQIAANTELIESGNADAGSVSDALQATQSIKPFFENYDFESPYYRSHAEWFDKREELLASESQLIEYASSNFTAWELAQLQDDGFYPKGGVYPENPKDSEYLRTAKGNFQTDVQAQIDRNNAWRYGDDLQSARAELTRSEDLLNGFFSQYDQSDPTYPSYQDWFDARTELQESHDTLETRWAEQERISAYSIELYDNPDAEQIASANSYVGEDSELPARVYDRIEANALLQGAATPGEAPPDDVVSAKIKTQALIEELDEYQATLPKNSVLNDEVAGHRKALVRSLEELTYAPHANSSTTAKEDFLDTERVYGTFAVN
jgi:hypothetical protein